VIVHAHTRARASRRSLFQLVIPKLLHLLSLTFSRPVRSKTSTEHAEWIQRINPINPLLAAMALPSSGPASTMGTFKVTALPVVCCCPLPPPL